jgi:hypothetical protein
MDAIAATECQNCGHAFRTEYRRLGSTAHCPACLQDTIPRIPVGGSVPAHLQEVTFRDFRQLIECLPYRAAIVSLLKEWFGYQVAGEGGDTIILNDRAEAIDSLWLHLRIQNDGPKQHAFYQTAQSLWR